MIDHNDLLSPCYHILYDWLAEGKVFFQLKADDGVYRSVSRGFLQLQKRVCSETFRQMT